MPCGKLEQINPSMNGMGEEHVIEDKDEEAKETMKKVNEANNVLEYLLGHQKLMDIEQKFEHNELEVKPSKLKGGGKGLFTNVSIPKDNILCFYPCDIIQDTITPHIFYKNGEKTLLEHNAENIKKVEDGDYNIRIEQYRVVSDESTKKNELYCGNFINDRAYHPKKAYKPVLNNCRFEAMNIVSNRKINKGEELYVTYSAGYWYNMLDSGRSRDEDMKEQLK